MSPPIVTDMRAYAGKTAYYMSKFGMTMVALGAAAEGEGKGVTGNSLWPATVIESLASLNFKMGAPSTTLTLTLTPTPTPTPTPTLTLTPTPTPTPTPTLSLPLTQPGAPSTWRKAAIIADCVVGICEEGDEFSGNMLIDEP